jgi:transcriptional regulator with XRE-family HTH domain
MNSTFDLEGFYTALNAQRRAKEVTWKIVADKTGVAPSTLTRMGQGKSPDAAGLVALATWAGLDPTDFHTSSEFRKGAAEPLAQITTILRADRNLRPEGVVALENMLQSAYRSFKGNEDET